MRWKLLFLLLVLAPATDLVMGSDWPQEVHHPKALITIYEPQVEELTMNDIQARAAVSVTLVGETEPHFGAVWISGRLEVDRDARTVKLRDVKVPDVRFPEAKEEDKQALATMLEKEIPTWELEESLDKLIALLELAEHEDIRDESLNHDPPKIVTAPERTVLVYIDGEPRLQPVTLPEKSAKKKIERVVFFFPGNPELFMTGGVEYIQNWKFVQLRPGNQRKKSERLVRNDNVGSI